MAYGFHPHRGYEHIEPKEDLGPYELRDLLRSQGFSPEGTDGAFFPSGTVVSEKYVRDGMSLTVHFYGTGDPEEIGFYATEVRIEYENRDAIVAAIER